MNCIYLDNSATTAPSEGVALAMCEAIRNVYGNPSSVHAAGIEASKLLEKSRTSVLHSLGIRDGSRGSLFFTSGGTESDNMAIFGVANAKKFRFSPRIITTAAEHPAVLEPVKQLEARGFDVVRLSAPGGIIDEDAFRKALTPETVLVSVMMVNNETGAVNDVKKLFEITKTICPGAVTHCDAVQGYSKLNCNPVKLGADLLTISAHKIHGPKGIGALWCSSEIIKTKKLVPIIYGGGQEQGFRSSTENVAAAAGFGIAAEEVAKDMNNRLSRVAELREALISALPDTVRVNVPEGKYVPHIVSITLPSVKSEVMVRALSADGIYVSAGSACSSHHKNISTALTDFGLAPNEADTTIRVSLSHTNTEEDVLTFASVLGEKLRSLQQIKR